MAHRRRPAAPATPEELEARRALLEALERMIKENPPEWQDRTREIEARRRATFPQASTVARQARVTW
jgi:hypothetical protein